MSVGLFEAAELGQQVSRQDYEARIAKLRVELINAQFDLRAADYSVVVLLDGSDRTAINAVLRGMHDWMDGRALEGHAYGPPSEEERERPLVWRYWDRLPRNGRIGVFVDGWALEGIRLRVLDEIDEVQYERWIDAVARFEQELADAGTQFVKLWFHVPKRILKKRIAEKRRGSKKAWQLPAAAERLFRGYAAAMKTAERMLRETSTGAAPWTVIESADQRHAELKAAETIAAALQRRLARRATAAAPEPAAPLRARDPGEKRVLDVLDLSSKITPEEYHERLLDLQAEVARLSAKAARKGVTSILAFEGWDAAGKGGAIRRITAAIEPRILRVYGIAAPTEEERAHHYLWRFWNRIPRDGGVAIFDRSWYGRVLVERVEGFAREDEWRRAYAEIRGFESDLAQHGCLVQKFWLHIDPDEQLRRFEARKDTPYKQYKLTDEDYRNREKWPDYAEAVHEMVSRTHTEDAPWHLVPATDKRFARIQVLEAFCSGLASRL